MNTSTVIVPRVSLKKEMVKTEGEEDKPSQDKDKDKDKDKENRIKTYDSYSKLHQMSTKKNPCTVLPRKEKR